MPDDMPEDWKSRPGFVSPRNLLDHMRRMGVKPGIYPPPDPRPGRWLYFEGRVHTRCMYLVDGEVISLARWHRLPKGLQNQIPKHQRPAGGQPHA